ncbi:MAG: DUF1826 domain-containing protein [Pseudomonadota bacterium]
MSFPGATIEAADRAVARVDGSASLGAFLDPGCSAAVWSRQTPSKVQSWLDGLDPALLPCGRVVLGSNAVARTVGHLFDLAGMPVGSERDWLQRDIVDLAEVFADLMQVKYLRLRLDAVTTNACRKFHVDAITARLVCTYRGTGTQYGFSTNGSDPGRLFTVQTGAPILLRGTLWPSEPASGLLHRSPPIEGSGETRLVLVLDPIFELTDEE